MITETRQLGGYGEFVTASGYNSTGAVQWMAYPGGSDGSSGEVVNYTYHEQMAIDGVTDEIRLYSSLPAGYEYTGQYNDSYIELILMGARWYDPELGRWSQPDTIVPGFQGNQGLDRYAYLRHEVT